jgi:hypothetical protein
MHVGHLSKSWHKPRGQLGFRFIWGNHISFQNASHVTNVFIKHFFYQAYLTNTYIYESKPNLTCPCVFSIAFYGKALARIIIIRQACQIVYFHTPKQLILTYFGRPWSGKYWFILFYFGIFYGHICHILWYFAIFIPVLVCFAKKNMATPQTHVLGFVSQSSGRSLCSWKRRQGWSEAFKRIISRGRSAGDEAQMVHNDWQPSCRLHTNNKLQTTKSEQISRLPIHWPFWLFLTSKLVTPGANPTIMSHSAGVVKSYNK